jgi:hypothetical protein
MQRMPKYKANPIDRRIFESSGPIGVKPVTRPSITEPEPFSFHTDSRIRNTSIDIEPEPLQFKALPFNDSIFRQPVRIVSDFRS